MILIKNNIKINKIYKKKIKIKKILKKKKKKKKKTNLCLFNFILIMI